MESMRGSDRGEEGAVEGDTETGKLACGSGRIPSRSGTVIKGHLFLSGHKVSDFMRD